MVYFVVVCERGSPDNKVCETYLIEALKSSSISGNVILKSSNVGSFVKKDFQFRGSSIIGNPRIINYYKTQEEAFGNNFELFI